MNRIEQIKDISERTGLSESIIRQVWKGTRESLVANLKQGYSYDIQGICHFKLTANRTDDDFGNSMKKISVRATPSNVLKRELGFTELIDATEDIAEVQIMDPDVITYELNSLK